MNRNLVSHFAVPEIGAAIRNKNPGCKHFGSEGTVSSLGQLPQDAGVTVTYMCTNAGANWEKGDMLTKTLDQLEEIDSNDLSLNEHTTDRNVLREWFRNRLDNFLND